MTQLIAVGKGVSKTDWMLYGVSLLLGAAVVLSNYYIRPDDHIMTADTYMKQILARMDAVSGQLSTWGAVDIRRDLRE